MHFQELFIWLRREHQLSQLIDAPGGFWLESHQIEPPGTGFVDFWSQGQKVMKSRLLGLRLGWLAGLGWVGWAGWLDSMAGLALGAPARQFRDCYLFGFTSSSKFRGQFIDWFFWWNTLGGLTRVPAVMFSYYMLLDKVTALSISVWAVIHAVVSRFASTMEVELTRWV